MRFKRTLVEVCRKVEYPDHPDLGHAGYFLEDAAYGLRTNKLYDPPQDPGNVFVVPFTAITDTEIRVAESQYNFEKDMYVLKRTW